MLTQVLEDYLAKVIDTQVEEEHLVAKAGNAAAKSPRSGLRRIDDVADKLLMTGLRLD